MHSALISLWLHEPDEALLARAQAELGLAAASPAELAPAFTHLFLLNVFPYGDVFTAPTAELNGPGAERAAPLDQALEESDLAGVILSAVGNVDRGDHQLAEVGRHHSGLEVERRVAVHRWLGKRLLPQLERHPRVAFAAVPEGVIVLSLDDLGHLGHFRLQLLEADHVRAVALQPFLDLGRAGPDAVHIPRGDPHE